MVQKKNLETLPTLMFEIEIPNFLFRVPPGKRSAILKFSIFCILQENLGNLPGFWPLYNRRKTSQAAEGVKSNPRESIPKKRQSSLEFFLHRWGCHGGPVVKCEDKVSGSPFSNFKTQSNWRQCVEAPVGAAVGRPLQVAKQLVFLRPVRGQG